MVRTPIILKYLKVKLELYTHMLHIPHNQPHPPPSEAGASQLVFFIIAIKLL